MSALAFKSVFAAIFGAWPLVSGDATSGQDFAITPSGPAGSVVSGTLYVDDFLTNVPPYGQESADELAAIPYTYTIG